MKLKLNYIGPGFVPGYPTKDIVVEAKEAEALVAGGTYQYARNASKSKKTADKQIKEGEA